MAASADDSLPSKYIIAAPQSYEAFDLSAKTVPPVNAVNISPVDSTAEPRVQTPPEKPERKSRRESWSDAGKLVPRVKEEDKDRFEAPESEDRGLGQTIRRGFATENFLEPRGASGGSQPDQSNAREKRAVWIVHGMGQQIPFETVDSLANGILDARPDQQITPRLRTVKIADQVLQRVELDIDGEKGDAGEEPKKYELHLYETYWAPKTEGVAQLTDVVSFLWDGGLRGLLNSVKSFRRAMFGGMAKFYIRWFTPAYLCAALLILAALAAINGVMLAAAGAKLGLAPLDFFKTHWGQLTALASCMVAVAFSFGALLFVADLWKPQELNTPGRILIGTCCWLAMACTVVNILVTAGFLSATLHVDWRGVASKGCARSPGFTSACIAKTSSLSLVDKVRNFVVCLLERIPCEKLQGFATVMILGAALLVAGAMMTRAVLRSSEKRLQGSWWLFLFLVLIFALNLFAFVGPVLITQEWLPWKLPAHTHWLENPAWVWPFLILFSAKVREILVQYVGDVAIYVRPNKLDRFDQVRTMIKDAARSVVSALFTAYELKTKSSDTPKFQYDKIALVGHSLGSVIAYDTLNRLMLDDWLCDGALEVAERTATLVTFGSPLNKTAFLFTIQGSDTLHIRERLASTVQPLIMSYPKFRKFKWINVFSRNDIVSGDLKFYDLPGYQHPPVPEIAVQNVKDRDAAVPLMAHVAYWKNKTVWTELLKEIAP